MLVLIVEENKNPVLKRIPNRLYTLREIIQNEFIEVVNYKDVLLVYDQEAFKKLLPVNRKVDKYNIRGTFIITGNDERYKDFKDLTPEQIEKYTKEFEIEQEKNIENEQQQLEDECKNLISADKLLKIIEDFKTAENFDNNIMKMLINKIEVFEDRTVNIIFNF